VRVGIPRSGIMSGKLERSLRAGIPRELLQPFLSTQFSGFRPASL